MRRTFLLPLLCMCLLFSGCSSFLGMGTIQETSPDKWGAWEKYHDAPDFLPESIDDYTVNEYSYTLYNYMDTCYEIYLNITVNEKQFDELLSALREHSPDISVEREASYAEGYTEIVFSDEYVRGETDKQDGNEQVGTAKIDKVIYNAETGNIIYVSFHAEDTDVYDVENIAYFKHFSLTPAEYTEALK